MRSIRSGAVVIVVSIALGIVVVLGATSLAKHAPEGVPDDFAAALAAHGMPTTALTEAAIQTILTEGISPDKALEVAQSTVPMPSKNEPRVYLASVTKEGMHTGKDEDSPLLFENVPMYLVQMTGVEVIFQGGAPIGDGPAKPLPHNTEMTAFVDAMSGQLLFTSSFR
jgi:hypothetical protein